MQWAAKVLAKVVLSRLPVPYGWWSALGIFRHGRMDDARYALGVFRNHSARAFPLGLPKGSVILELGPGNSVASALIGYAHAASTYLVDVAPFADRRVETYRRIAADLAAQGLAMPSLDGARSLEDVLVACRSRYLTSGIDSLKQLDAHSIDFLWSHSVLANVRKADLEPLVGEMQRILKPGGLASHDIDFRDHLDQGLNALRFPDKLWEWDFLARSGFYTNRVPAVTMRRLLTTPGLQLEKEELDRWASLPIPRAALDTQFQAYTDAELTVMRARPPARGRVAGARQRPQRCRRGPEPGLSDCSCGGAAPEAQVRRAAGRQMPCIFITPLTPDGGAGYLHGAETW
jgi:SAM-dependent methyltransferase